MPDYDYAAPGAYFISIVTHGKICLFGHVIADEMHGNGAGEMVKRWWKELWNRFPLLLPDEFLVMPNHVHGIVMVTEPAVTDARTGPTKTGGHAGPPLQRMIQWFKAMTTNEYIRGVKSLGWPPFAGKLWQRNYYEQVIRNEFSLNQIRRYIQENPLQWALDRENPARADQCVGPRFRTDTQVRPYTNPSPCRGRPTRRPAVTGAGGPKDGAEA